MAYSLKNKVGEGGFTLIELVVVVAIIGIMTAMAAYTYFAQVARMKLNGDVRKVDQVLQQAKMHAITYSVPTGVVFVRRDGNAIGRNPDEFYIFSDSTGNGLYTDDDTPCKGCKEDGTPLRCSPTDSFPSCAATSAYLKTHDNIVDGPFVLETGDYFTLLFGSKNPTADARFTAAGYEYILYDSMGHVIYPLSPVGADSRRIYLQNHSKAKDITQADRGAVQITFLTGVSQVIRLGPAPVDEWLH